MYSPACSRLHGLSATVLFLGIALMLSAALPTSVAAQEANGDDGPDENEILRNYSLYWENLRNENFESAAPRLRWILEHAPTAPRDDDRNYRRAVDLYKGLAENSEDNDERIAYLDSAAVMLATSQAKLDEKGVGYDEYRWEMRKGRFLQEYGSELESIPENLENAPSHYENAFRLDPERIDVYFVNVIIEEYLDRGDPEEAIAFMSYAEEVRGDDEEVMSIVNSERDRIFDRNPRALMSYLEGVVEDNPEDNESVIMLFELYVDRGEFSKANELAEELIDRDPPAEVLLAIANLRIEDGESEAAIEMYERAEEEGATFSSQDHYNMGRAKKDMGQLSNARTHYRNAIDEDDSFVDAYIAIGDLYVDAVSECAGSEMGRSDRAVYWAAVDQFEEAVSVAGGSDSRAESKINTYQDYFPRSEDIFYRDDWTEGESYTIDSGCYSWINETTVVRR